MELKEITTALESNEELAGAVLSHVLASEKGKAAVESATKLYWKNNIGEEMRKVHNRYDQDLEEITGIRRADDEKTYDVYKRVLKEYANLKESGSPDAVDKLKQEIETLKAGNGSQYKDLYEQLKSDSEQKLTAANSKYAELEKSIQTNAIRSKIMEAYAKLDIDKSVFPEEVIKTMTEVAVNKIASEAVMDEQIGVVFRGEDGKYLSAEGQAGFMTVDSRLEKELSSLLRKKGTPGGGATDKGNVTTTTGDDGTSLKVMNIDMTKVKNRRDYLDQEKAVLAAHGIDINSQESADMRRAARERDGYVDLSH